MWGLGEYPELSEALRPAAEALADACAVSAGQEVLDVAAGDGNFAIACAREGASVVASDLSPGMVERGRARSEAEGYDVEWVEADVEALPFDDASFDCVGSVFGAMIAPRPRVVAEELFRVVRPGGTVGMTAWTPRGFSAELFRLGRSYAPRRATSHCPTSGRTRTRCASASTAWRRGSSSRCGSSPGVSTHPTRWSPPSAPRHRRGWPRSRTCRRIVGSRSWARRASSPGAGRVARSLEVQNEYALIVARKRG